MNPHADDCSPPEISSESSSKSDKSLSSLEAVGIAAPRSVWHRNKSGPSSSPFGDPSSSPFRDSLHSWADAKADYVGNGFGNGPKKPRTQAQYTLPSRDSSFKSKGHNQISLPYQRLGKANDKKTSDASKGPRRNLELVVLAANLLINSGDKGWRECGVRVCSEAADQNEWKFAVKCSGELKYIYKVHQDLPLGSSNRYISSDHHWCRLSVVIHVHHSRSVDPKKAKRWTDHLVLTASRTVFHYSNDAVVQLLRVCFQSTLGINSPNGVVGNLLGHGFGSHCTGGIAAVAPGILYLRVHCSVRDVMFVTEEIVSLLLQSVKDIVSTDIPIENLKRPKSGTITRLLGRE